MYAPNHRTAKYVNRKMIELKREIDKSTDKVGDVNIHSQQLMNSWTENCKDIQEWNTTISQHL